MPRIGNALNGLATVTLALVFTLAFAGCPCHTRAADTYETWDAGATNFEVYSLVDGVGLTQEDQGFAGDMVVGWGLVDRFSAYFATTLESNGAMTSAEPAMTMGVFGTPVNTDHFDLDLALDVTLAGEGMSEPTIGPTLELNYDADPGMATWGLYTRSGLATYGSEREDVNVRHTDLALTVGTYWTLAPDRQLLLEYDAMVHDKIDIDNRRFEHGALALGFNTMIAGNLELISEVRVDIPQADESSSLGLMLGVISTMP